MYCLECDEDCEYEIKTENEKSPVKGVNIEVEIQVTYCKKCGNQIWNEDLEDKNIKNAFRKYRDIYGLLQPEEIKTIRNKYKLTQTVFAKILGLGEKTIARYEGGSLQDVAQNNIIKLMENTNNFECLFKDCKTLTKNERSKVELILESLKPTEERCAKIFYLTKPIYSFQEQQYLEG